MEDVTQITDYQDQHSQDDDEINQMLDLEEEYEAMAS